MMMRRFHLLFILLCNVAVLVAQPNQKRDSGRMTPEMYIEMFKEAAITDMLKTGVPASITLAQGMYESDYGNSPLAKGANNHFGIKCHKDWTGNTFHQDDDAPNECFRKYESVQESYDDHSNFLRSRDRYRFLFDLEITDYKGWSHGLKKAGYATNPAYAGKLIDIIERFRLYEYDNQGQKMPVAGPIATAPSTNGNAVPKKEESLPEKKSTRPVSSRPRTILAQSNEVPSNAAGTINGIPYVKVAKGDTWTKLARENNIELWQVLEFNDAQKNDVLKEGEHIFIRPKKNKAEPFTHTVAEGETMRDIAQQYGVRLARLYKMNEMNFGENPIPGKQIYLKRAMLFGVVL